MMYRIILSISIMLLLNSFKANQDTIRVIIPFEGVGNLILGESTFNEVKKEYGKTGYYKYWEGCEFLCLGNYVKKLEYPELGITLYFRRKRRIGKFHLSSLILSNKYVGEMLNGIKIGSDYNSVIGAFGKKRIVGNGDIKWFTYYLNDPNASHGLRELIFYCFNNRADTSTFKVDKIVMRY